jgi:hypothetical protein
MEKMPNEGLIQISEVLGSLDSPSNIIDLFKETNHNTAFKEKIINVFLSLAYPDAAKVYKLFESVPDVKDSWIRSLELRVEKNEKELLQSQHDRELAASLDLELGELLKKHTECDEENSALKDLMKVILLKEIENTKEDPTELESELLASNEEIMIMIKDFFKKGVSNSLPK